MTDIVKRLRAMEPCQSDDWKIAREAADEIERLRSPDPIREEMASIVQGFLDCLEIADCAPEDKDGETHDLEHRARAALSKHRSGG